MIPLPVDVAGSGKLIDQLSAALPAIKCRRLCGHSCSAPVIMSWADKARIAAFLGALPQRHQCGPCPLFDPSAVACRAYAVRPIICRLWGVSEIWRCPHGCIPDRYLTQAETLAFIQNSIRIGSGMVSNQPRQT